MYETWRQLSSFEACASHAQKTWSINESSVIVTYSKYINVFKPCNGFRYASRLFRVQKTPPNKWFCWTEVLFTHSSCKTVSDWSLNILPTYYSHSPNLRSSFHWFNIRIRSWKSYSFSQAAYHVALEWSMHCLMLCLGSFEPTWCEIKMCDLLWFTNVNALRSNTKKASCFNMVLQILGMVWSETHMLVGFC